MKKAKKALLVSVCSLVFAVVIATTATLAWFAMSNDPTVEEFELTVTTNENLYISASLNGDYGFDLSAADLTTVAYRKTADTAIVADKTYYSDGSGAVVASPVVENIGTYYESYYPITGKALDACTPVLNGEALANEFALKAVNNDAAADTKYYSFDLHFLSTQEFWISADYNRTAITTKTQSPRKVVSPVDVTTGDMTKAYGATTAAITAGTAIDAEAANAARIAFVVEGVGEAADSVIMYNPNSNKGWSTVTTEGQTNMAKLIYDAEMGTNALDYTEATTVAKSATNSKSILQLATIAGTASDTTLRAKATALGIGADENVYYGTVKVYIWLEGKDADCFASIYSDVMKIALAFNSTTAVVA